MTQVNAETKAYIKKAKKENNVMQWQIAEQMGMSEFTFSRKLRHELSEEEKQLVMAAVDQIRSER